MEQHLTRAFGELPRGTRGTPAVAHAPPIVVRIRIGCDSRRLATRERERVEAGLREREASIALGGSGRFEFTKIASSPVGDTVTPPYAAVASTTVCVESVSRSSTPMSTGLTSFVPET